MKGIEKAGCKIGSVDIQCVPCDGPAHGGFIPPLFSDTGKPQIVICENHLDGYKEQERTMVHELIHFFDDCRARVNWANLHHQACSEIRASMLSGECNFFAELGRGNFGFRKHYQTCVQRRAILSVSQNPNCQSRQQARDAVLAVWDTCFRDTQPFSRRP
eukprot:c7904_g1_i1.p1 GENE.c7904_g1_i1~~c7904_g1_i1.p1  ORF type:complete len:160 (+),score=20.24 c7904_g1_i1:55-534(+)